MTPVVEACELVCGYGGKPVLAGLSLAVQAGERVALLGPNGSGKSTLLRAFAGLLKPDSGEVRLSGEPVGKLSVREIARRVATVPQEETPRFAFTVRQMVTMGRLARSAGLFDTAEDREEADRAMDLADCLRLEDRPVGELSGGERQRVLIARALAQGAPLVLLDEPTSHLDPAHQLATARLIRELSDRGVATITAIHDLNFAGRVAERAILLEGGRIGIDAAVETVLRSPILDRVYGVTFYQLTAALAGAPRGFVLLAGPPVSGAPTAGVVPPTVGTS